ERRRVVKSFKDRLRAKLPVSVAEVGDTEALQVATFGLSVVANETGRCHEILASALAMARVLPDAVLCDVRTEVLPFGGGGKGLSSGIEQALDREPFENGFPDDGFPEDWKRDE
ncbi:MAG TPA: DUF503 domain-containing protein, partial [Polyangiaceae bacterium]|nr:DUF503 domain-containing protein [Polyangiaceae bacterium]